MNIVASIYMCDLNLNFFFFFMLQHYIVYMGHHSHPNSESVIRANHEVLASVTGRQDTNWIYAAI